jgi:hypothetical protein
MLEFLCKGLNSRIHSLLHTPYYFATVCTPVFISAAVQDATVMANIANHFKKSVKELEWDDEDAFVEALQSV